MIHRTSAGWSPGLRIECGTAESKTKLSPWRTTNVLPSTSAPKVSDADFKVWSDTFSKMMATPEYDKLRAERGLFKFALTGKELDAFIKDRMVAYRQLAGEFKLKVAN